MVIAIQKRLGNIKQQLETMGFETVIYENYKYPIDALIYIGNMEQTGFSSASFYHGTHSSPGIFMVNAENKSAEEIAYILKKRLYSPLF